MSESFKTFTDYQVRKNFVGRVIDFTEKKLERYSHSCSKNEVESGYALTMLQQYLNGQVAIRWQNGRPSSTLLFLEEAYTSNDDETFGVF